MQSSKPEDSVRKSIVVACSQPLAFRVWTEQIDLWWPEGHSLSQHPQKRVKLEAELHGRIFEETPDGQQYVWGEILVWEPPSFLAFSWVMGSGAERPSRVEVRFVPLNPQQTRVDLLHLGPDLLGDLWPLRVEIFNSAWEHILRGYKLVAEQVEI